MVSRVKNEVYKNVKYTSEIDVTKSPSEVFDRLVDLSKWWPEEYVGEKMKPDCEFVFRIEDSHYSKNKVIEFDPNKKLAWVTTGSHRKEDKFDWTGTKMIFEITPKGERTVLTFTYDGVVFESEKGRLVEICDFCIKSSLYNLIESVTVAIEVAKSPQDIFKCITGDVAKWWGGKDLSGSHAKLHDEFIVNHPGAHYSKQKLIEVIPDKRIVWLVTESKLDWLEKDMSEWTGTKMIFEITAKGDVTLLNFVHNGLVPHKECYDKCSGGWNMIIKDYLFNYLTNGKVAEQLYR
jgi:hypothetical protein